MPSEQRSGIAFSWVHRYPMPTMSPVITTSPTANKDKGGARESRQLLHLVFGGELESLDSVEFSDISGLDIVGIYPNYAEAYKAWKAAAQRTVDSAQMRYFIVHMHRLLDPALTGPPPGS